MQTRQSVMPDTTNLGVSPNMAPHGFGMVSYCAVDQK